jgi:hypothetical protein
MTIAAAAALSGLAVVAAPAAAVASGYDGDWTVLVITERGKCSHTHSYDVRVSHGSILYTSYSSVTLHGTVTPQGAVRVAIRHFEEGANGSGQLSARRGAGDWRGAGRDGVCSGRWEAHRR